MRLAYELLLVKSFQIHASSSRAGREEGEREGNVAALGD